MDGFGEETANGSQVLERTSFRERAFAGEGSGGHITLNDGVVSLASRQEPGILDASFRVALAKLDVGCDLRHRLEQTVAESRVLAALRSACRVNVRSRRLTRRSMFSEARASSSAMILS